MERFKPLQMPLPEQVFEDFKGLWFVRTSEVPISFLVRDTLEIEYFSYGGGAVDPIVKKFYFDTAWEAHEAAMQYYNKHNENYPYMSSYIASGGTAERADMVIGKTNKRDIESQVMDFM